ncbi:MAG TPA: hypothetical protein VGQ95_02300 [Chthoniobacterales bacterium]|nr:hypothetical protein [Chthoniobacterales bacterium]
MENNSRAPEPGFGPIKANRWLFAALVVALVYSLLALRLAFRLPYLVQDDARQHIFWMRRYLDPTIFPNDLIANYFQSIGPAGYKALYWIFAKAGIDPMLLAKLLPATILAPLCIYLCFRLFMRLMPDPRGAFVSSVLLCQVLWLKDDVISATPRAFAYPLFLLFVLLFLRRSFFVCSVVLALEGLFYPPAMIISIGIVVLYLIRKTHKSFHFSRERSDYIFCGSALLIGALISFAYERSIAAYGPVLTADAARSLPEFGPTGRSPFFLPGYHFWLDSRWSGFFPVTFESLHVATLLFPLLCLIFPRRERDGNALLFLLRVGTVSFALWATAHAVLFKLYLPSRYSWWVWYIIEPIAAGMMIALLFDIVDRFHSVRALRWLPYVAALALLMYPHWRTTIPRNTYVKGSSAGLYSFLQTQPKNSVIAALGPEADMIPTFAQRSVLVGAECAIPFHQGYYRQIRERGQDLVRAEYSPRLDEVRAFIRKYHVDLWVIDRRDFQPGYLSHAFWFRDIGDTAGIERSLGQGQTPALLKLIPTCGIWQSPRNVVLDAHRVEHVDPNLIE